MKKILFWGAFFLFFSSCIPMEKVTSDEYLDIRIHNREILNALHLIIFLTKVKILYIWQFVSDIPKEFFVSL